MNYLTWSGWRWVTVVAYADKNQLTLKSLGEIIRLHHLTFLSLNENHFNKDAQGPFIQLVCELKKLTEVHIKLPEVQHFSLGTALVDPEDAHLDAREIELLTHCFENVKRLDLSGNKLNKESVLSIVTNCKHLEEQKEKSQAT